MFFYGNNDELLYVPVEWTDVLPRDIYVTSSSGPSFCRVPDLLELHRLVSMLRADKANMETDR